MYRMAHKKTAAEKFSYKLQVPLTPAQHKVLEAAAKTEGLALASWVRQVALRAVRTEAQSGGARDCAPAGAARRAGAWPLRSRWLAARRRPLRRLVPAGTKGWRSGVG